MQIHQIQVLESQADNGCFEAGAPSLSHWLGPASPPSLPWRAPDRSPRPRFPWRSLPSRGRFHGYPSAGRIPPPGPYRPGTRRESRQTGPWSSSPGPWLRRRCRLFSREGPPLQIFHIGVLFKTLLGLTQTDL